MGELLEAARLTLTGGDIAVTGQSTDFLTIDAQVLRRGNVQGEHHARTASRPRHPNQTFAKNGNVVTGYVPNPVIWRRTFELSGAPAGFSARVIDRFRLDVRAIR